MEVALGVAVLDRVRRRAPRAAPSATSIERRAHPASGFGREARRGAIDRPADALVHDALGAVAVLRLAGGEELPVAADRLAEPLRRREHEAVVAVGAPEEAPDLVDEPLPPARPVTDRVERPALVEVLVHVLLLGEPPQVAQRLLHRGDLRLAARAGAEVRREPLEAEPRRVDLLEVLAGQPAHDRAARRRDGDEALALELAQAGADRRRRDAELLREVALDERRARRQLAVDDQLAERLGHALLDRLAVLEGRDRRHVNFHPPTVCSMLAHNAICYRKSQMSDGADRGRRRRHVHRRDPPRGRRARPGAQAALDAAELRPGRGRGGLRARRDRGRLRASTRSCTARPSPRTPSSSASAPRPRSSRPSTSATCSSCAGCGSRTCTTSSGPSRRRSSSGACASRSPSGWPPTAPS